MIKVWSILTSRYALELWYINIKVSSQHFYLTYLYGQGLLSRADLSLCTMLLLTSPTLFCILAIAFKKTTLFPTDRDMWMWLTKTLLSPALLKWFFKLSISQLIKLSVMVHELSSLPIAYSYTLVFPKYFCFIILFFVFIIKIILYLFVLVFTPPY